MLLNLREADEDRVDILLIDRDRKSPYAARLNVERDLVADAHADKLSRCMRGPNELKLHVCLSDSVGSSNRMRSN